jgi:hypothetical protein
MVDEKIDDGSHPGSIHASFSFLLKLTAIKSENNHDQPHVFCTLQPTYACPLTANGRYNARTVVVGSNGLGQY